MCVSRIQAALARISAARSVDEGDDHADELARAARDHPQEIIDLYHAGHEAPMVLVWCLRGQTSQPVIALFREALHHRSPYVRWAAAEGLKHSAQPDLIPVFTAALRDRAHLVKAVAVDWLTAHGDDTALPALQRLSTLPGLARSAPGTIKAAEQAIASIRQRVEEARVG